MSRDGHGAGAGSRPARALAITSSPDSPAAQHAEVARVAGDAVIRGVAAAADAVESRALELSHGRPRDDIALIALQRVTD